MATPLTSESALATAVLIDGDQMPFVELREVEEAAVEGEMVMAGGGRKGKRAEYRCAACGYGIVVYGQAPACPFCRERRWRHVEWRPFSQPLSDLAFPFATRSQRRRLRAPSSPTLEQPIRHLHPGQAGASLEE